LSRGKLTLRLVQYFFGIIVAAGTLAPLVWMFIVSVSNPSDLNAQPLKLIPTHITFERYKSIFTDTSTSSAAYDFRVAMENSAVVAIFVTLISLVVGAVAAYAFARLKFRFKKSLLLLSLFVYMIPPVALVVPMYLIYSNLGMLNNKPTLVIIYLSFIIPFIIWVMQSYFGAISKTYEEAANIDGCNRFQILYYIFLPIARPGLIATGILAFLMSWDEFFLALIFTSNLEAKTLTVAISEFNGKYSIDYGMISAAGVLASLLPALIVLLFQKYIVMGMTAGGIKE
jgi:multiple sugar transport system permease protein